MPHPCVLCLDPWSRLEEVEEACTTAVGVASIDPGNILKEPSFVTRGPSVVREPPTIVDIVEGSWKVPTGRITAKVAEVVGSFRGLIKLP